MKEREKEGVSLKESDVKSKSSRHLSMRSHPRRVYSQGQCRDTGRIPLY